MRKLFWAIACLLTFTFAAKVQAAPAVDALQATKIATDYLAGLNLSDRPVHCLGDVGSRRDCLRQILVDREMVRRFWRSIGTRHRSARENGRQQRATGRRQSLPQQARTCVFRHSLDLEVDILSLRERIYGVVKNQNVPGLPFASFAIFALNSARGPNSPA